MMCAVSVSHRASLKAREIVDGVRVFHLAD
jgi:hypothetical protein